jgi:hypothetical protein
VLFDAALEELAQCDHQFARRFVAGAVRNAYERPQVTHGQLVAGLDRRLGLVPPLGGLDFRHERLSQSHDTFGARLGPALLTRPLTLEMKSCPHCRDTPAEKLLGDRLVLDGQALEHRVAMSVTRVEPLLAVIASGP